MEVNILRQRDGGVASVTFTELFFDLIYVFCVTQLSHYLLHHLSLNGIIKTAILWGAVWLAWQYTAWVTNWFNPDARNIRLLLFFIMLSGLCVGATLPEAFNARGFIFALAYVSTQVGRTIIVLFLLDKTDPLRANFERILGWLLISALFWLSGGLCDEKFRMILWGGAVIAEYISPMIGFQLPFLGRSDSQKEWKIEGHHLAERCQLFVIVALGEVVLTTGSAFSHISTWTFPVVTATLIAFGESLAMWWIYFDTSSKAGGRAINQAVSPGQMGAYFHYLHIALVGAIIVSAVANELVISHPDEHIRLVSLLILFSGPALFLIGSAIYKNLVYRCYPSTHILGLVALCLLIPVAFWTDLLMVNGIATLVLISVAILDSDYGSEPS